jgi:hypothetical protein
MMEQDFNNINDYQQTNSEDIMNQIDVDYTQPLDQQIDTAIQVEDTSATIEATTANSN